MSEYDNTNSGALFRNDKGDNPKRPDYKGKINIEGREFSISGWLRESQSGKKYMSLKVEPPFQQPAQQPAPERPRYTMKPEIQPERPMPPGDDLPF